jgi:foldase protein PrsA
VSRRADDEATPLVRERDPRPPQRAPYVVAGAAVIALLAAVVLYHRAPVRLPLLRGDRGADGGGPQRQPGRSGEAEQQAVVLATVGGTPIYRHDLLEQLEADYGHELLSRMIDRILVDQAFANAGLEFPQEKLEGIVQEWRHQAGSEEEFQGQLAIQGRNEQDLRENIEIGIKIEMLGQKDLIYTEEDLRRYYEEHQDEYGGLTYGQARAVFLLEEDYWRDRLSPLIADARRRARISILDARYADLEDLFGGGKDSEGAPDEALPPHERRDVAIVNSEGVTRAAFVKQLEADYGHGVLSRMTDYLLVDQAFAKAGLEFPQEKLGSIMQEWRDQAGSEEEFQRQLTMQGRTEQDLREAAEMGIKIEMLGQKDLSYTEADLRQYYKENRPHYDEPERVAFSEIVVESEKKAEDIYEMATRPDAKFLDLAKQYSIAPSGAGGGRRPPMTREDIIPVEARDIAFALSEGEVSKPFKAAEAWMIIKLNERLKARKLTFAEAREKVEEDYKREHMVQAADLVHNLRNNADVRIVGPDYADLQPLYGPSGNLSPGGGPSTPEPGASKGAGG